MVLARQSLRERYEQAVLAAFEEHAFLFEKRPRAISINATIYNGEGVTVELKPLFRTFVDKGGKAGVE